MKSYKQLAAVYLKKNKTRSFATILGVAFCVIILFTIMSLVVSLILTNISNLREQIDYEVVFRTETREKAEQIAGEACLKSARVEAEDQKYFVYAAYKNPYLLQRYTDQISGRYGASYETSEVGAYYSHNKTDLNLGFLLAMTGLLIAFIFAILGVGVVRNSVQLITLEHIRDYGILRCIGAKKGQLRKCVYTMGMILELMGIALGTILGFPVYCLIAKNFHLQIGFHWIALPLILAAFLGDLFFVMQENCKFVNSLTPAAAMAGVFKYKMEGEKIKARRGRLIMKLFGVEWGYAYKNLMRNPSRFWSTVRTVGMGIATLVLVFNLNQCVVSFFAGNSAHYGKYQAYCGYFLNSGSIAAVPDRDNFEKEIRRGEKLKEIVNITSSKPVYETALYTADPTEMIGHFSEEFLADSAVGGNYRSAEKTLNSGEKLSDNDRRFVTLFCAGVSLYGYDEEDYRSLKGALAEGTLDVSDHGIVLVNHTYSESVEMDAMGDIKKDYKVTDYHVGDKITFVDMKKLSELVAARVAELGPGSLKDFDPYSPPDDVGSYSIRIPVEKEYEIYYECYQELLARGQVVTYTIEGILNSDTVFTRPFSNAHFVLPLERYFQATGTTAEDFNGMMYHMKGTQVGYMDLAELRDLMMSYVRVNPDTIQWRLHLGMYFVYWDLNYITALAPMSLLRNVLLIIAGFVLFIVLMNVMNILNTTASNLYLRRKEFAQLRVLGMSKKRLKKTVMFEGILTGIAANVFGLVLGIGFTKLLLYMMNKMFYMEYHFPWLVYLIGAACSMLLFCGSIWVDLSHLKVGMAEELSGGGE